MRPPLCVFLANPSGKNELLLRRHNDCIVTQDERTKEIEQYLLPQNYRPGNDPNSLHCTYNAMYSIHAAQIEIER